MSQMVLYGLINVPVTPGTGLRLRDLVLGGWVYRRVSTSEYDTRHIQGRRKPNRSLIESSYSRRGSEFQRGHGYKRYR